MRSDPWLERWLPLIRERCSGELALDIGCGYGDDVRTLVRAGFPVLGWDRMPIAVSIARRRVPLATIEQCDFRERISSALPSLGLVVASLSMHYYPWDETLRLVAAIRKALRPGGLLLCRLNSTSDRNFGAGNGEEVEPNFYVVGGHAKRFFDEKSVETLFSTGWATVSRQHLRTRKYLRQKALWEIILEAQ